MISNLHSKISNMEYPPAFLSFVKCITELLSPQAPASPSSLPSVPVFFNESPGPLPPTLSSSFPTFSSLRSFFLNIPSSSLRAPRAHTQPSLTPPAPPPFPRCPPQPPAALLKFDPGFRLLFSG